MAKDVGSVAAPLTTASVPRLLPFAEKETEPVGLVPKTERLLFPVRLPTGRWMMLGDVSELWADDAVEMVQS